MNLLSVIAAARRRGGLLDPLTLTPALWLDASDDATLFDATSGGSLPTNGNDIMRWEDKSTNDRHFTQGSAAACPHRQTGVQNGLPVARFDGADDVMNMIVGLDIVRDKAGASVVAVYRWLSNPNASKAVFVANRNADTGLRFWLGSSFNNNRKLNLRARRLDADTVDLNESEADNPTACFVHAGIVDYQNRTSKQYVSNSVDVSKTGILSAGNTQNTASHAVRIASNGTGNFSHIDLSELFVFDRAISDDDRNALNSYLTAKWGI